MSMPAQKITTDKTLSISKAIGIALVVLLCLSPSAYPQTMGDDRVSSLIQELKDKDPDVRWRAVDTLGAIGIPAVESLIAALKDNDAGRMAVEALAVIGGPAVESLIKALKDNRPDVREGAVAALGKIKDARVVEPLISALKDDNPGVRERALMLMARIRDARVVEPLLSMAKGGNSSVRQRAIMILGKVKDARSVKPLISLLKDKNPEIRRDTADALWDMRGLSEVKTLIETLKDAEPTEQGLTEDERKYVVEELLSKKFKAISATYAFFIRRGNSDAEPSLVGALNMYGDTLMATDFMNCGNYTLGEAALKWARDKDITINTEAVVVGPLWGRR